ncbi:hypothetical protein [Paludisphaera borealis]|uniref:Uncharacterized protein n=1 Tax=Paludisphaera borealis TaxID=1387353 RepID=A0A1U7CVV4_9BACT|nr:hypothetical protein [Paludisphaera borealis]APW63028.1 hypothetical protein BSF38_04586 [Paludisphaera borealis]
MTTSAAVARPGRATKVLAVLSVAGFWALPFSPMVAIAAVGMTEGTEGWARKTAVAGAVWCTMYTTALAALIAWVYLQIPS